MFLGEEGLGRGSEGGWGGEVKGVGLREERRNQAIATLFKYSLASAVLSDYFTFIYCISLFIRRSFFLPKHCKKSRFILKDRPRSLELFRKGETCIMAKLHRTDLVICSHSSQMNTSIQR